MFESLEDSGELLLNIAGEMVESPEDSLEPPPKDSC